MDDGMDFGEALAALKDGFRVKRAGWVHQWLVYDGTRTTGNPYVLHLHKGAWPVAYVPSWQDIDATDWEVTEG